MSDPLPGGYCTVQYAAHLPVLFAHPCLEAKVAAAACGWLDYVLLSDGHNRGVAIIPLVSAPGGDDGETMLRFYPENLNDQ